MDDFVYYVIAGFVAQMIDGTLGMAGKVSASTLLLTHGLAPAAVSATVHAAGVFTSGVSGVSHHFFGNVDRKLFWRLTVPGVVGAVVGAYVLCRVPGEAFTPAVAVYLLGMGCLIVYRGFRPAPALPVRTHLLPLGFFGALIDAIGGGGWGPIVASTLVARGNHARLTVGSVNAAEFFVTLAASATFVAALGLTHWPVIAGLAVGGVLAAPLGAWACRRIPHRPMVFGVGVLVIGLSLRTLIRSLV